MLKNCCDLCGKLDIKQGQNLCPACQQAKGQVKKCGEEILKAAQDVANTLKIRGMDLKQEVEVFEQKLVDDFLATGRKVMEERFASLEAKRKEVKALEQ